MNFGHFIIYIIIFCGVFLFNLVNTSYVPYLVDIVFLALSLAMLWTGLVLRSKVKANFVKEMNYTHEGEAFTVRIEIENGSFLPLTAGRLVVFTQYGLQKRKIKTTLSFMCPAHQKIIVEFPMNTDSCDRAHIRFRGVYVYDYIHVFRFCKKRTIENEIVIFPKLPDQRILHQYIEQLSDDENTLYSTHQTGDESTELFAIREYESGDRLRNIHWKLSSKMEELMVKTYAKPLYEQDTILIDGLKQLEDKKQRSELFSHLYGLMMVMLQRGFGFYVSYEHENFRYGKIDTENDLWELFAVLYEEAATAKKTEVVLSYYESHSKEKNRIFYVTHTLNEKTISNMLLLEEIGPVFYLIPGELLGDRIPKRFTGEPDRDIH